MAIDDRSIDGDDDRDDAIETTMASTVTFIRRVALERGRAHERWTSTRDVDASDARWTSSEGSIHRARLLRLRAVVFEGLGRRARGRQRGWSARGDGRAWMGARSARGDVEDGDADGDDGVDAFLEALERARSAWAGESDGKAPRGWTGSASAMSRSGTIRVGRAHQAEVPAWTDARAGGGPNARESYFLGARVFPVGRGGVGTRVGTRPSPWRRDANAAARARANGGKGTSADASRVVEDERGNGDADDCDDATVKNAGERADGDDVEEGDEGSVRRKPLFSDEEIARARRALEDGLRASGVDESSGMLGLRTIGAANARENWDDDEIATFSRHVTAYADDLIRLKNKLPKKTMRDVVSYYYNVWQIGVENLGRVDIEGAEAPAPRERRRGPAPKYTSAQIQLEKDQRRIHNFLEYIRAVAMNPKRAMLNVHRAPTTTRVFEHMMARFRAGTHPSPGDTEGVLSDLEKRKNASLFTKEELETQAKAKAEAKAEAARAKARAYKAMLKAQRKAARGDEDGGGRR